MSILEYLTGLVGFIFISLFFAHFALFVVSVVFHAYNWITTRFVLGIFNRKP